MERVWKKIRHFLFNYEYALVAWAVITIFVLVALYAGVDRYVVASVVVLVGILGEAFTAAIAWISFIPVVGPLIAKVLSLPFIWLINGVGYLASIVAINRGYSKDVVNYRIITFALLTGITIGYILGKII